MAIDAKNIANKYLKKKINLKNLEYLLLIILINLFIIFFIFVTSI